MASTVQIRSQEGTVYNLDSSSINSSTFKGFLDRILALKGEDNIVTVVNTPSSIVERMITYLLHNLNPDHGYGFDISSNSSSYAWNKEFIKKFTGDELVDLVSVADHLHIYPLVSLGKARLVKLVDKKSVDTIRKILNISSNLSLEEEGFINEDSRWEQL